MKLNRQETALVALIRADRPMAVTVQRHANGEVVVCVAEPPDDASRARVGVGFSFIDAWSSLATVAEQ